MTGNPRTKNPIVGCQGLPQGVSQGSSLQGTAEGEGFLLGSHCRPVFDTIVDIAGDPKKKPCPLETLKTPTENL